MDELGRAGVILAVIGFIIFAIAVLIFANSTDPTGNINWWAVVFGIALTFLGIILLYWSNST